MNFHRKSVASMVIVAMLSLGLAPVAQAQEKKDNKILALGVIGGLVFVATTVMATHKNSKEITKLRYEAMADRRVWGDGLVKTNSRLNAIIASMEKRQKALQGEQGMGPSANATIDSPTQQSTRYVEVQNDSTEEVFLRNIISSGPEGASEEKLEWPIPAKSSTRIILSKMVPLEKLFAVDSNNQPLTIDIVKDDKDSILITPNG